MCGERKWVVFNLSSNLNLSLVLCFVYKTNKESLFLVHIMSLFADDNDDNDKEDG